MILPIIVYPDSILRESISNSELDYADGNLISIIKSTLSGFKSNWLTAKHLGYSVKIISIKFDGRIEVLINPIILEVKGLFVSQIEIDPSFPNLKTSVIRRSKVLVQFTTEEGERIERWFSESTGRLVLQGVDQLQGSLIIDNVNGHRLRSLKGYLGRLEKGKFKANYPVKNQQLIDNE
jgi:peptide deformylase